MITTLDLILEGLSGGASQDPELRAKDLRMKEVERHIDTCERLSSFEDEVLVVCPRCAACAKQIRTRNVYSENRTTWVRKLVCAKCGLAKKGGALHLPGVPLSPTTGLALWLQTPCCGDTLWALNLHHLETLESYVRADLREQHKHPVYGWSSKSVLNRLPKWIKAANHRDEILKSIGRLKDKLPT